MRDKKPAPGTNTDINAHILQKDYMRFDLVDSQQRPLHLEIIQERLDEVTPQEKSEAQHLQFHQNRNPAGAKRLLSLSDINIFKQKQSHNRNQRQPSGLEVVNEFSKLKCVSNNLELFQLQSLQNSDSRKSSENPGDQIDTEEDLAETPKVVYEFQSPSMNPLQTNKSPSPVRYRLFSLDESDLNCYDNFNIHVMRNETQQHLCDKRSSTPLLKSQPQPLNQLIPGRKLFGGLFEKKVRKQSAFNRQDSSLFTEYQDTSYYKKMLDKVKKATMRAGDGNQMNNSSSDDSDSDEQSSNGQQVPEQPARKILSNGQSIIQEVIEPNGTEIATMKLPMARLMQLMMQEQEKESSQQESAADEEQEDGDEDDDEDEEEKMSESVVSKDIKENNCHIY